MFLDSKINPRMRVILSNDFAGDPDGLVQLAHHLLSPSVDIRGIIGSFFSEFFGQDNSADHACTAVRELLEIMNLKGKYNVYKGADSPLDENNLKLSEGSEFIIKEAMRRDTNLPLYILCGASLTDIASSVLKEPGVAEKTTVVWIGGNEYSDTFKKLSICPPVEYNLAMDIEAAKIIFSSTVNFWQVPRDVYRQALMSYSELATKVKPCGKAGKYLAEKLEWAMGLAAENGMNLGEAYVMGDSPLVLLTALQSGFDPDPSSSEFVLRPAPDIDSSGQYIENSNNRKIRVYTKLDVRILLEDFYLKLSMLK